MLAQVHPTDCKASRYSRLRNPLEADYLVLVQVLPTDCRASKRWKPSVPGEQEQQVVVSNLQDAEFVRIVGLSYRVVAVPAAVEVDLVARKAVDMAAAGVETEVEAVAAYGLAVRNDLVEEVDRVAAEGEELPREIEHTVPDVEAEAEVEAAEAALLDIPAHRNWDLRWALYI